MPGVPWAAIGRPLKFHNPRDCRVLDLFVTYEPSHSLRIAERGIRRETLRAG